MSLSELLAWCQTCDTVPEDSDSPFVVHKMCFNEESSNSYFKLFFTTKRLLDLTALPRLALHADATYKLIWNGFPVLLVGSTDCWHTFYSFGLAVVPNEDEDSFAFLFRTLHTLLAHEINGAPLHSSPCLMLLQPDIMVSMLPNMTLILRRQVQLFAFCAGSTWHFASKETSYSPV